MRLVSMSLAVVAMLASDMPAISAPGPEQVGPKQAAFFVPDAVDAERTPESGLVTFRLNDWLGDNGSGGFPVDFTDENWVNDPWEEPPQ